MGRIRNEISENRKTAAGKSMSGSRREELNRKVREGCAKEVEKVYGRWEVHLVVGFLCDFRASLANFAAEPSRFGSADQV